MKSIELFTGLVRVMGRLFGAACGFRQVAGCVVLCLTGGVVSAQVFTSGSTGADGALNVVGNMTLAVPPNGVFNYTTITVARSAVLRFQSHANNPPVFLLATGDVVNDGTITLNGEEVTISSVGVTGPGGFRGGSPGGVGSPGGAGHGPGGGLPGTSGNTATSAGGGSFGTQGVGLSAQKGVVYGNPLLFPIIGGSGGGGTDGTPGRGGGGGGGAVVIASSTRFVVNAGGGLIEARGGGISSVNQGSGGAIRLVAPVVSGGGALDVTTGGGSGGGAGRIRIDAHERGGLALVYRPSTVVSIGALLAVVPDPLPRIDVIEAAGNTIAAGSGPVVFTLPQGSPPGQGIRVRVSNFDSVVPLRLVAFPDHGVPIVVDGEVDNRGVGTSVETTLNVTLPVNDQVGIYVFTR